VDDREATRVEARVASINNDSGRGWWKICRASGTY